MQIARQLMIIGQVQGVGYRYAMSRKAAALGVRGWVRNRIDGNVEALIQGAPEAVAAMVVWARHGPNAARVDRVEVDPAAGEYDDFRTLPTA